MTSKFKSGLLIALSLAMMPAVAVVAAKQKGGGSLKQDDAACRSCVSQAASLFASNQLEQAATLLRQSSPRCPKNAQLHLLFSTVLVRMGPKLAAEAESEAALACAAQPNSQAAHLQYAMTLQAREKFAEAAAEFERVSSLNPASYEAWSSLADLYKRLRRDDEAKSAEAKAAGLEPGTQAARLSVLQNLKRSGKTAQAKKELKRLLQAPGNIPEFEQALAGEALQLGSYDEAIEAGRHVLDAYPNSSGPRQCLLLAQFLRRQYQDAIKSADTLIAGGDKGADLLSLRAICNLQLGKRKVAESDLDAARAIDASSPFYLLAEGLLKISSGDFERAEDVLKLASEADTRGLQADKIPQGLANLALARLNRKQGLFMEATQSAHAAAGDKRFEAAALALESRALLSEPARADALAAAGRLSQQALLLDPGCPEAILADGFCQLRSGKLDEASRLAQKAKSLSSDSDIDLLAALIAEQRANLNEQKQELEAGLMISPGDPELLYALGRLYLKDNKASAALPVLKQAMERRVKGPEICFALAEACEKTGDAGESIKYYKQSLSQGLSAEVSQQAKAAISRLESGK